MFTEQFSNINLEPVGVRLPEFNVDKKLREKYNFHSGSNFEFLKHLTKIGYKKIIENKVPKTDREKYQQRLDNELSTIQELGFVDYFLLVWDIINFANENGIAVGPGRGSCCGSTVLYLIGATKIDPIKNNLIFARFISKIRAKKKTVNGVTYLDGASLPDIDTDIDYYRRNEVIDYLEQKFKGKTAKILTINTFTGKMLIKDCGKVVGGKSETEMNQVSGFIPKHYGKVRDIKITKEGEKDEKGKWKEEPVKDFKNWCDKNNRVYEIALKLRSLNRNKGIHPSGIAVSYEKTENSFPSEVQTDGKEVSSFDMNWILLYNVKLDLLGLRSVSVVDECLKSLGKSFDDINPEDSSIYQALHDLQHPHGIFQIEAETNFRVCQKVKPKNLMELSAVLALARPGALQFVDEYAAYTNTGVKQSVHPFFDDTLASTGGLCLFQESQMQMAQKIGFTPEEANDIRKIVGKKRVDEAKKWKNKIFEKIKENNLDKEIGETFWQILEDSANYSFCLSHGAAYATLSALTVYLKFNYPKEFFLSLLKMTRHETDPTHEISIIEKEMKSFGLKLLPPHLIKSNLDFSIESDNIRFGLLSIKGISDKSAKTLDEFKHLYKNKFEIFEGAKNAKVPLGILTALIQAGALEGFKQSRTKVVYEAQVWSLLTEKEREYALKVGHEHDYDMFETLRALTKLKDEKNKPIISIESSGKRPARRDTIKKNIEEKKYQKIYRQNKTFEKFANWYYETKLLGYAHSDTLKAIINQHRPDVNIQFYIDEIAKLPEDGSVSFVGTVEEASTGKSKKGTKYLRLKVNDEKGSITTLSFDSDKIKRWKGIGDIEKIQNFNDGKLPKEGDIIFCRGKKRENSVFASDIIIQRIEIYTRLAEMTAAEKGKQNNKIIEW